MPNIELLEKATPVAPIRIAALAGCQDLAKEVDKKLVKFRKELVAKKKPSTVPQGYSLPSFLVECECVRFGTGEGKGYIKESVRGADLFIMVDITNYTETYTVCGHENHMSPDNHYQDLKRIISAATGKAHRINVIMPFLYEGRQHRRTKRVFPTLSLLMHMTHVYRTPSRSTDLITSSRLTSSSKHWLRKSRTSSLTTII